jgi:hypothetical protein
VAVTLAVAALTADTTFAQELGDQPPSFTTEEPVSSFYTIDSHPERAHMSLRGGTELAGDAPLAIPGDLYGSFRIDVHADGYERQRGVLRFPGGGAPLEVSSMHTGGAGAVFASVALPGLGELVRGGGDEVRGASFLAAGIGGLGGLVVAELRRRNALDDAERLRADAALAPGVEERTALLLDAGREAATSDRARVARRDWAVVCAAVWTVSLIDTYRWTPRLDDAQVELTDVTFNLRPLSRTQAALRSIVPGLGQHYAGRERAGTLAFLGGLAAGMGFVIAEHAYDEAVHQKAAVQALYDDPLQDPEALAIIRPALEEEAREADDARKRRNVVGAVAAGVWTANILDAFFATPTPHNGRGSGEARDLQQEGSFASEVTWRAGVGLGSSRAGDSRGLAPSMSLRLTF